MPPITNNTLAGTLYVNLLDVGDQGIERRKEISLRLCEVLHELCRLDPAAFPLGNYLPMTEKLLAEGSELGEEPLS